MPYLDFHGLASIKFSHAFNFRKCDIITIFEAVPDFIKGSDNTFFLLGDASDHGRNGLFTISIENPEFSSKVREDLSEKAGRGGHYESNVVLPGDLGHA